MGKTLVVILRQLAHVEPTVAPVTAYSVDDLTATTLSCWRLHFTITCVGKMRIFTCIYIRILHVGTSAHPHIYILPPLGAVRNTTSIKIGYIQ